MIGSSLYKHIKRLGLQTFKYIITGYFFLFIFSFLSICNIGQYERDLIPSIPQKETKQTEQNQIRRREMQRLNRVSTICKK